MTMGFFGEEIESSLTEKGGSLNVLYAVDVNDAQVSKNEIYITVREI